MVSIVFTWGCIYRAWSYGFYCFYLGLYLQSVELWFLLFLPGVVSTEPGVMVSISLQRTEKIILLCTSENIGLKSQISNSEININISGARIK
jgi:hypothetical protein